MKSDALTEPAYTSNFPPAQANSSSFPSGPLPEASPSFSSLHAPDTSDRSDPQPSIPPTDYPCLHPSAPAHPNTPSMQQTSFIFPTPPHSNSSSPESLLSSSSSPSSNSYHPVPETVSPHTPASFQGPLSTCRSNLSNQLPDQSLPTQPSQPLGETISDGNAPPMAQTSATLIHPNFLHANPDPAPFAPQTFTNQYQLQPLAHSLPTNGGSTSFAFPSVAPQMQSFSLPSVSPRPAALHLSNLSHQATVPSLAAAFPHSSFAHSSPSLPHRSFQTPPCLALSSSFQQSVNSAVPHTQNLPNPSMSSSTCSFAPAEMSGIPQFSPAPSYRPDMVLHHPALLPQLDASLPSATPPPALYSTFPSYPLRLHQDPHSSLSIPFRHLYRQHQHGHPHPYLDASTRTVF
ncbi:T-box transcription factor TBX6-like [Cololabis saira]|uniref:T-box transcription factor TBX6-like n=1 Tax=Cololabis saira TaxID=129043 RepID=UPI002AD2353D|nr:T-box transcription factor TBX6-like [Cololabis saira]